MSERPAWKHATPEATARWLWKHPVVRIDHRWEFTGEDTSRQWLVLHADLSGKGKTLELPGISGHEITFRPDHRGLVQLYQDVITTLQKIDAWEKSEARDLAEYRRLSKKLGVSPAV